MFASTLPLLPVIASVLPVALSFKLDSLPEHLQARHQKDKRHPHPHNPSNPVRHLLSRSITNDASSVNGASFDFIIAGGGLAGLAVAARLSEWNNVTVLVIEAGGDGSDVADRISIPGYSYLNGLGGTGYDWQYQTVPQVDSGGGRKGWPRGKGLGGSGAINGLYWCRAAADEYDAWDRLNPDRTTSWGWQDMQRYINKAENLTTPSRAIQQEYGMNIDTSAHGDAGPIQIGFSQYMYDTVRDWIPTWVNLGIPSIDGGAGTTRGVTITPLTVNMFNQTRSDSKAGYIDPLPPRSNLVILTGQQVTQILFSSTDSASGNKVASGVRFQAASGAQSYTVQATKEVILSGGTVGSPQILQLSGIAPKTLTDKLNINSVVDLPVGYNLQDHVSYSMYWRVATGTRTWSELANNDGLRAQALQQYNNNRTGLWTFVNQAVGYPSMTDMSDAATASDYASRVQSALASTASDVTRWQNLPSAVSAGLTDQYAIQAQWINSDVGQVEILLTMLGNNGNQNEIGIQVAQQHPWSRGTIFISSTDAFTPPDINPDYFGVGYDIDIMAYGSGFARTLASTAPLSNTLIEETLPGAGVTGDALNDYTKNICQTEYHPLGTCSMLPRDKGGVVNTNLIVYGTENIRVIDSSIMPLQISAHLMASTYGIAEKGADLIKEKYWAVTEDTSSASASQTTASVGRATDTSVTNADAANNNNGASAGNNGLSTGAKIGIGAGAGVAAVALLAGLLVFCCMKRRKSGPTGAEKGYYQPSPLGDRDDFDPSGGYKESRAPMGGAAAAGLGAGAGAGAAYPMANFTAPAAPFGAHSRSESQSSMATADMYSRTPMRNSDSAYNIGEYGRGGDGPYRDTPSPGPTGSNSWDAFPRQQTYKPVNLQ